MAGTQALVDRAGFGERLDAELGCEEAGATLELPERLAATPEVGVAAHDLDVGVLAVGIALEQPLVAVQGRLEPTFGDVGGAEVVQDGEVARQQALTLGDVPGQIVAADVVVTLVVPQRILIGQPGGHQIARPARAIPLGAELAEARAIVHQERPRVEVVGAIPVQQQPATGRIEVAAERADGDVETMGRLAGG